MYDIKTMRLKFNKVGNEYHSRILWGKGGISSCVSARYGGFWFAFGLFFKISSLKQALTKRI